MSGWPVSRPAQDGSEASGKGGGAGPIFAPSDADFRQRRRASQLGIAMWVRINKTGHHAMRIYPVGEGARLLSVSIPVSSGSGIRERKNDHFFNIRSAMKKPALNMFKIPSRPQQ